LQSEFENLNDFNASTTGCARYPMRKALAPVLSSLVAALLLAPPARPQAADWQKAWDETLAAARKEGKVVVVGSPHPEMRNEIVPRFTSRFGIAVDFIAGRSVEAVERVRIERSSGIFAVDAFMVGASTNLNMLYADKMIDPLPPLLILPEVTDGAKWKPGRPPFIDPEGRYILRPFSTIDSLAFINTDRVKPEEIRSVDDLLNPKWKGKISTEDPTLDSGSGGNKAVNFYSQLGPEFVRKLYADQKPAISRSRRQFADWLARGTYPICLTCRIDDTRPLQQSGYKILAIYELSGVRSRVNSTPFTLSVAGKAPHPNAMRVFVNWLAGREAVEIYSRGDDVATLRTDVDESFLDPAAVPRPGVTYPDDADPAWRSGEKLEIGRKIRALLKN
jgi:iron(III) transport system substrate-binding protein